MLSEFPMKQTALSWQPYLDKNVLISSVQGRETFFCTYDRVFGIGEFKYAVPILQGANDIAMATKFRQKTKLQ